MSSYFEELQKDGKRLAAEGRLHESLEKFVKARDIKETPKINSRIQKLKDAIDANARKNGILHQIENIPMQHKDPANLTPESLKIFNKLKNKAMGLSYEGKFDEALHYFYEAQKLCDCPKVKKYIQELEALVSKYPEKLEEFQNLTDTGKKLASAGRQAESLEKLKNAFAVCPSPAVSRMIKKIQTKCPLPDAPVFSSAECEEHSNSENGDKHAEILGRKTDSASSVSKENHLAIKSGSSGSDFSLSSGCKSTYSNPSELSPKSKEHLKCLYSQAKECAATGQLQKALDALEDARKICPTEKVLKRIKALKEHMKQLSLETSYDMIEVKDGFFLFHEIFDKLYPYQREGVAWMWKLFKMKKGGVLGDDMGLGKTFQVIAYLSGLIDGDLIKNALIIMPVSLLPNWEREFKKWCPGISVNLFHGSSKKERERSLLRVQRRGHVLLTSYGMVLNALPLLTDFEGRSFVLDYVILDEGHKIKNPTKTTKAVHAIPSKNRLVLTGTPVQNNLLELWALYDFVHQGTLLGSLKTFKMQYENPITRARERDSSAGEKRLGTEMAENLKMLIKPYFLRRTKSEIWPKEPQTSGNIDELGKEMEQLRISENKLNARKNDLIVWTFLSDAQCEIYESFLHSEAVKTILVSKRSPLVELSMLKKICDHPRLLSQRACLQLGLNGDINDEDLQRELNDESSYSSSIKNVSDETLMAESGKMKFLVELLENLKNEGHRTLVFSLSRKILDMISRILTNRRWKVLRIDGTISKIEERERRIQLFQNDPSYSVFLLTTQVGGVGITLTAADRVVIYDPSWNPATDAQAVDRVYRIGQQRNVIVYRLITCGTVEEKIYRRQIFKDSITKQATCSTDPYRYFSKQELRELFTIENPRHSATQVQLSQLHSHQRQSDTLLDAHIAFLYSLDIFGISDHDLMFSRDIQDDSQNDEEAAVSHDYIKKQVAAAQTLIQTEASVVAEGIRLAGTFSRPFSEPIPTGKNSRSDPKPKKSPQTSPSDFGISHQPDGNLAVNKIKYKSGQGIASSTFISPVVRNRENYLPFEDSSQKTKMDEYTLDTNEHISIIELNSDDEEHNNEISQISSHGKRILNQSGGDTSFKGNKDLSNIISNAGTPAPYENVNPCSDISIKASSIGSDEEKDISLHYSESEKDIVHEDADIHEDVSFIASKSDVNNHSFPSEELSSPNIEQIIGADPESGIQSDHSSVGKNKGANQDISQVLTDTEAEAHQKFDDSTPPPQNSSTPILSNGHDFPYFPVQKNMEESYIQNQEISTHSDGTETSEVVSNSYEFS